jgi:hypothetical protein
MRALREMVAPPVLKVLRGFRGKLESKERLGLLEIRVSRGVQVHEDLLVSKVKQEFRVSERQEFRAKLVSKVKLDL